MADLSRYETALRNADAAGDVEAARRIANEIKRLRAQSAPASVKGQKASAPAAAPAANLYASDPTIDSTTVVPTVDAAGNPVDTSGALRDSTKNRRNYFVQGMKTGAAAIPLGTAQAVLDNTESPSIFTRATNFVREVARGNLPDVSVGDIAGNIYEAVKPANILLRPIGGVMRATGVDDNVQAAAQENARRSAVLATRPGGLIGQVVPGVAAAPLMRGVGSGYSANALLGATMGTIQPVAGQTVEERTSRRNTNAVIGGAAGAGGTAVANGINRTVIAGGRGYNAVRAALAKPTAQAAEQAPIPTPQNISVFLTNNGIDPATLRGALGKDALFTLQRALATGDLDSASAIARQLQLASLKKPIQGTRGQLTQDFAQRRQEQLLADSGDDRMREFMQDQTQDLNENLKLTRGAMGGQPLTQEEAGRNARATFEKLRDAEKAKTRSAYAAAEQKEGALPVTVSDDFLEWMRANAGFEGVGGIVTKARALGLIGVDDAGNLVAKQAPARNLYELRRTLSNLQKSGGTPATFAGEAKDYVDDAFEQVGPLYKQAAAQRRQQAVKYEMPQVLQKIYGIKNNSADVRVADEKLIESLQNSSIADLRVLKQTLMRDKDIVSRRDALQLWQDMRQQALDRITKRSFIEDGKLVNVNYQTLKNELDKIGDDRLRLIFGPKAARELRDIERAAKILLVSPRQMTPGSGTAGNLLLRMNSVLQMMENLPKIGPAVRIARSTVGKTAAPIVRDVQSKAATTPITQQMTAEAKKAERQRQLQAALRSMPASSVRRILAQMAAVSGAAGNSPYESDDIPE